MREVESEGERGMLYRKIERLGEKEKDKRNEKGPEDRERGREREKREGKLLEKGLCVRDR